MKFKDLEISESIKKALDEMGFENATEIQEKTLPLILEGHDIIGQAQTGTGKTGAFGIPIIEKTDKDKKGVQHVIISPTRELAEQIAAQLNLMSKGMGIKVATLIGGVHYQTQERALANNPQIVVGTPGRIQDHLKRKNLKLDKIATFILDEADEMLKQGFKEDIDNIITYLPGKFQSLLFSATMEKEIEVIANQIMKSPIKVSVSSKLEAKANIEQQAIIVKEPEKFSTLLKLVTINKDDIGIIFGRTKRRVDELASALQECGIPAKGLHGDLSQRERSFVLEGFKKGKFQFLVATDVAARGIDINDIKYVYNFDLPQEVEYYVHRIGRTGRAGKEGKSISFLREAELPHLAKIERETKSTIKIIKKPTDQDVLMAEESAIIEKLKTMIGNDKAGKSKKIVTDLLEKFTAEELVSVLVNSQFISTSNKSIKLSGEPAVRIKGSGGGSRSGGRGGRSGSWGNRSGGSRDGRSGGSRGGRSNGSRDGRSSGSRSGGSRSGSSYSSSSKSSGSRSSSPRSGSRSTGPRGGSRSK